MKFGSSVVIYPEGTLNRQPDKDGNILPVKSLYSFKIAEDGKALVCPAAIVWIPEKAKTENRVIISFLEPIHTDGMKAKEIADKWQFMVGRAIDSMNIMIKEMEAVNTISAE